MTDFLSDNAMAGHHEMDPSEVVLIVDDLPDNCELIDRYLRKHGYVTESCYSGAAAIARVSEIRPKLILLDWMMPGLSGFDTLVAIREIHSDDAVPIIMCTAIDEDVSVVNALRSGANDYVTKPINFSVMLARIETQLGRVAKMQELSSDKQELEKALTQRTAALLKASRNDGKS